MYETWNVKGEVEVEVDVVTHSIDRRPKSLAQSPQTVNYTNEVHFHSENCTKKSFAFVNGFAWLIYSIATIFAIDETVETEIERPKIV